MNTKNSPQGPNNGQKDLHDKILDIGHALEYSKSIFIFCSEQRLTTFRYFIVYLVALSYGIYELYQHQGIANFYVLILVIISFIISFIFFCLEGRNKEIIGKARESCMMMEKILSEAVKKEIKNKDFKIDIDGSKLSSLFHKEKLQVISRCKTERKCACFYSYGNIFRVFFVTIFLTHLMALGLLLYCNSNFNLCSQQEHPRVPFQEQSHTEDLQTIS